MLQPLAEKYPVVAKLLEYRTVAKAASSFGENILEYIELQTGRIHADFRQIGAPTGRFSCSKPNLQQIPHEDVYRRCFRAENGRSLVVRVKHHRLVAEGCAESFERERVCAVAVRLINLAWFRVGSDRYAKTSRTHGVTTLSRRHVSIRESRVTFRFRAKHSVQVRTTLVDIELAEAITDLLDQPGGARLFRYGRNGDSCALTGAVLNAYIREYMGEEFTAKDFRTPT